jgi:hypothetical protein
VNPVARHRAAHRRVLAGAALALLLAGSLSACSGSREEARACPSGGVIPDAGHVTKFRPGGGYDVDDVVLRAMFTQLSATCDYSGTRAGVDLEVEYVATRGPADQARSDVLAYFVAVVDPAGNVLAREEFASPIEFPPANERVRGRETIRLDRVDETSRILVGFRLTEEELRYNRREL